MKIIIPGLLLLSSFSVFASECVDLSGKYFVESPTANCSVEMIVGGNFDEYTVGYSPFLMGFAVDLKVHQGIGARAGNGRAFEVSQKDCQEIKIDAWAYQQTSDEGITFNLKDQNPKYGKHIWNEKSLDFYSNITDSTRFHRYRNILEFSYYKDEEGNLHWDYHATNKQGLKTTPVLPTVSEYKAKCVFKRVNSL